MNPEISAQLPAAITEAKAVMLGIDPTAQIDDQSLMIDQLLRLTIESQTGRNEPILLPIAINGLALLANHSHHKNN